MWCAGSRLGKDMFALARRGLIEYQWFCKRAFVIREPRPTNLFNPSPEIVHQGEDLLPGFEHLCDPIVDGERKLAF
jgi:hypothetical protein